MVTQVAKRISVDVLHAQDSGVILTSKTFIPWDSQKERDPSWL